MRRRLALCTLVTLMAGCGERHEYDDRRSKNGLDLVETPLTFTEWCDAWGLACAEPAVSEDANATRALLRTLQGFADSASNVVITRAELDASSLAAVAALFEAGPLLGQAKQRLDQSSVSSAAAAGGALTLSATAASDYAGTSGLITSNDTTVRLTTTQDGQVLLSGLSFAGPDGGADSLSQLSFQDQGLTSWQGANTAVSGVPATFLSDNIFGEFQTDGDAALPGYPQIAAALAPLKAWIVSGQRDMALGTPAFAVWADSIPGMIEDPAMKAALSYILRRVNRLESTTASRRSKFLQAGATQDIVCRLGTTAQITLERTFGVDSVAALGTSGTTLVFRGIKVKPLSGVIRPTIQLGRVDLEPGRIVIYNVPIVGTYEIDMTTPSDEPMTLSCPG